MPGRTSQTRSSSNGLSRKSSNLALNSRRSTIGRLSSPHGTIPDEGPRTDLRTRICSIFTDVHKTTAGHRKLVINLRKLQEACCYEPPRPKASKDNGETFDEENFNIEFTRCVLRVMAAKKSEAAGDRIVRFLGVFLKHASDKDNAMFPESNHDDTAFPETPTTRLTSKVLSTLLPLLSSKEKTVRYRSTQIISHIINSLDSIDDDLFGLLRLGLLRRIRDKESMVRVQAVLGLGRLAGNEADGDEDDDEDEDDAGGMLDKLLEVLQNDSSADVRRSLLLNLPLTPETLPFLLERARDQDPATRRALYSRLLPALGDFRHLSLSMREKLLRWGLRDRDENVRKAAGKLFRDRWIEDCAATKAPTEGGAVREIPPPSFDGLLELLERIDVVNSGLENGVALEAMKGFWEGRGDYREAVNFDASFWDCLSAESVFMARSFNDFCRQEGDGKYEALVDEKMPEVTALAFFLQRYINALVACLKQGELSPEGAEDEDDPVELEFIVEQLLHIALTLDYSDEVGRRKMFSLLREIIALPELPEEVTRLSIEVLRGVCGGDSAGEREFCGVVLEAVAEVHDTIMGEGLDELDNADDSFHSARSELSDTPTKAVPKSKSADGGSQDDEEKAIKEIMVNMKCLHIAQCMLEFVSGNLQSNIHLVTMLNNLVVPAVRSHEAPIRERGLLCLGLCCLLDRGLAEENLTLFLHCYTKGHDALQVSAIHIISDILLSHGPSLLALPAFENGKPFYKMFAKALKADDRQDVQAASAAALCKLMLSNVIKDEDLLKAIVVAYFDPSTAENLSLRQGLSYFIPVYCHSRKENQERMQRIAVPAIHSLGLINENMDEEEEMVSLNVIAAHLVDWTDPRKLITAAQDQGIALFDEMGRKETKALNCDIHLGFAKDVLEKILNSSVTKEERKTLASTLSKIFISSSCDAAKLTEAQELAAEVVRAKVFADATSRNAVAKLVTALAKAGAKKSANARVSEEGVQEVEPEVEAGSEEVDESAEAKENDAVEDVEAEEANDMVSVIDEVDEEEEDETDIL